MPTPVRRALVAGFALALLTSLPLGATPGFWHAATQADFLRGDVEHLSIDEHGRLMLGPEVRRLYEAGVPFVWTMLAGPDDSVFIGTGNEGKVMRVDRSGTGSVFFDSGELEVHALANGPNGGLYVGTSPDGRVYRVDAKGQGTSFFDPEDKYIWAMVTDAKGTLYVATGDKGVVYRVTPDGKGTPFFSTKTTHAISLALDPSGQLLVGTGSPGRVFRVDAEGKGFLLLDTSHQEIKSLRVDSKRTIFVAAQTGRPAQGGDSTPFAAPAETLLPQPVSEHHHVRGRLRAHEIDVEFQAGLRLTPGVDVNRDAGHRRLLPIDGDAAVGRDPEGALHRHEPDLGAVAATGPGPLGCVRRTVVEPPHRRTLS